MAVRAQVGLAGEPAPRAAQARNAHTAHNAHTRNRRSGALRGRFQDRDALNVVGHRKDVPTGWVSHNTRSGAVFCSTEGLFVRTERQTDVTPKGYVLVGRCR
ncbi:hypothetical protein GCM10010421_12620 [Streptomyces glaucus]|uniref:Secreted protein n=1 Tax=Streptomyces glaucus TaxID=284029 RepID=A0ABP5WGB4_9ACTN